MVSLSEFNEKLKWDVIATQHALLYQRALSAEVKPQTVTLSSGRNNKQTNQIINR